MPDKQLLLKRKRGRPKKDEETAFLYYEQFEDRRKAFLAMMNDHVAQVKRDDVRKKLRRNRAKHWNLSMSRQADERNIHKPKPGVWWDEDEYKPLCELHRRQLFKKLSKPHAFKYSPTYMKERIGEILGRNHKGYPDNRNLVYHIISRQLGISMGDVRNFARVYEEAIEEVLVTCGYVQFRNFGRLLIGISTLRQDMLCPFDGKVYPIYKRMHLKFRLPRRMNRMRLRLLELSRKIDEAKGPMQSEVEAMDKYEIERKRFGLEPI